MLAPVPPAPARPARLWSLDIFRGLCAALVFLSHWHLWSGFAPQGVLERSVREFFENIYQSCVTLTWPTGGHHPAVLCFFVLSGFCIHYPYARRGTGPDWRDYYRRRFLRIFPVYWTAALLGLLFVATETLHPSGNELLHFHATAVSGVALRLLGAEGFYPKEIIAGNYILTTIGTEVIMYALYPWIYRLATRAGWLGLGCVFLGAHLLSLLLLVFFTPFWVFNSVFMLGIFWWAGAFAAHLFLQGRDRVSWLHIWLVWGTFLALKALPHFYGLNLIKQADWGLVCVLTLLRLLRVEERHPGWVVLGSVRSLRYLGKISYSLYAVHTPAIMFSSWMLIVVAGCHDYFWQLALTLGLSVAFTIATHYLVETRFYPPAQAAPKP